MKKILILAVLASLASLAGCANVTVKAIFQYPAPVVAT